MTPTVTDVPDRDRFEIDVGDGVIAGFAQYRRKPGTIAFIHTEIDPAHAGAGLATLLVEGALDSVRAEGVAVLPFCPFVRDFIRARPAYLELVPAERRAAFGFEDAGSR